MLLQAIVIAAVTQAGNRPDMTAFTMSVAKTAGEITVPGLTGPVRIARDDIGVPEITGEELHDVVRAQGFVHGQERFLQMDLLRRVSSGRLAALVGARAVESDRAYRSMRCTAVADAVVRRQPDDIARLLEAYAEGVNAGLAALDGPPPEYSFMGVKPEPWLPRDTILTLLTMSDTLNWNKDIELRIQVMLAALPEDLVRFLLPEDTRFESPLLPGNDADAPKPAIPGSDVIDLRGQARFQTPPGLVDVPPVALGSNNWAIAGSRSAHGGAIVANDPHLEITVPGIWYRVELAWSGGRAMGLSLPGSPGVLIGSNGHLAWGFTNSQGDFQDWIVVEPDPDDARQYRTPDGPEPFTREVEVIEVAGGAPIEHALRMTRWGPIARVDHEGRGLVLRWTALDPEIVNMDILRMMVARTLEQGVEIARAWYGPSQNVVIADDGGRIAWAVSGYFPRRLGFDGEVPRSWAEEGVGWAGPMDESLRPVVVDPPEGILYTANNRTVDLAWARMLGNGWDIGARARRIAELLRTGDKLDEEDLLSIQLDTRVEIFDFYRDLAIEVTNSANDDPLMAEARVVLEAWNGRADLDQSAVRLLHVFRNKLHEEIMAPLLAPCLRVDPFFHFSWARVEESMRRLLEVRPQHLCPPGFQSWDAFIRETLASVLATLIKETPMGRLDVPWGAVNRTLVRHPMAEEARLFASMLNMPSEPLPGHRYAVRVGLPRYGASARMVVSPGREERGVLHIPAGQSGHPLSPHYRDSHAAWLEGRPTSFRVGEAAEVLTLVPSS